MRKITLSVLFSLMLIMPAGFGETNIQDQQITLTTDNTSYIEGDIITVSGKVSTVIKGLEVSLQVFFDKNQIRISQAQISNDGRFTDIIKTGGDYWKNEGPVTIKATYGESSTEITIEFFKKTLDEYAVTFETKIPDGGTFDVPYTIKGGEIKNMIINKEDRSLEIEILSTNDGFIDVNLLRDSIDSISEFGQDIDYIVLIYQENSDIPIQTEFYKRNTDDTYRGISIPFKEGDYKIKIVGTKVVPEFGTIAMIVLAVAIVSIIAVSAKSRLSIVPRI